MLEWDEGEEAARLLVFFFHTSQSVFEFCSMKVWSLVEDCWAQRLFATEQSSQ